MSVYADREFRLPTPTEQEAALASYHAAYAVLGDDVPRVEDFYPVECGGSGPWNPRVTIIVAGLIPPVEEAEEIRFPEAGVHPAELVSYVEGVLVGPNPARIVTYSPLPVRAAQAAVRRGDISPNRVRIMAPTTDGGYLRIPLTARGAFARTWPLGFFPEEVALTM